MGNSSKILIYTRKPQNEYTESLSNSIHLAYCEGENAFKPLNQNYGILFALATIDKEGVIHEKGLRNPYLFGTDNGSFGIAAVRVDENGKEDAESKGQILLWTSDDLITFNARGLLKLHETSLVKEVMCNYNSVNQVYEIHWKDEKENYYVNYLRDLMQLDSISMPISENVFEFKPVSANLSDIMPGNILQVDSSIGEQIKAYWTPIYNTEILVPDSVSIASFEELKKVKATAVYSDGSTSHKQIKCECEGITFETPGTYEVKGRVVQELHTFPLARGYADPVILPWDNKYYYIATNDNKDDIGMYVREADTISELIAPGFKESIILDLDEEKGFVQTFWAPEFHVIGDELFILFAVSGKVWGPQCHML